MDEFTPKVKENKSIQFDAIARTRAFFEIFTNSILIAENDDNSKVSPSCMALVKVESEMLVVMKAITGAQYFS